MSIVKYVLLAISLTLAGGCATYHVPGDGTVYDYQKTAVEARENGTKVVINYECDNGCLIKLSSGSGLRVSKDAKFGVREPRFTVAGSPDSTGIRLEEKLVNDVKKMIPSCVVVVFDGKNAFKNPAITYVSGREILANCPQIKEYQE